MKIGARRWSVIGLDVGARNVRASQLVGGECRLAVFPRLSPGTAPDASEACRVMRVLDRLGFQGRRVSIATNPGVSAVMALELPPRLDRGAAGQLARVEVARALRVESSQIQVAAWPSPTPVKNADATHLVAAGVSHQSSEHVAEVWESADAEVVSLAVRSLALYASCRRPGDAAADAEVVIDIGSTAAQIVLAHAGVVVYERLVAEASYGELHRQLSRDLRATDAVIAAMLAEPIRHNAEERERVAAAPTAVTRRVASLAGVIAQEASTAAAFVATRFRVHTEGGAPRVRVRLCGGAAITGLAEELARGLDAPVQLPPMPCDMGRGADPVRTATCAVAIGAMLTAQEIDR